MVLDPGLIWMQGFGLQSVSIRGMAESNSDMASERIQRDFKQLTGTVSSIFKTSQKIRIPKLRKTLGIHTGVANDDVICVFEKGN